MGSARPVLQLPRAKRLPSPLASLAKRRAASEQEEAAIVRRTVSYEIELRSPPAQRRPFDEQFV